MTDRQLLAWNHWLDGDWNRPNRGDHYLMQVAAEVRRVPEMFGGKPERIRSEQFKITFVNAAEPGQAGADGKPKFDRDRAMAEAMRDKAIWGALLQGGFEATRQG